MRRQSVPALPLSLTAKWELTAFSCGSGRPRRNWRRRINRLDWGVARRGFFSDEPAQILLRGKLESLEESDRNGLCKSKKCQAQQESGPESRSRQPVMLEHAFADSEDRIVNQVESKTAHAEQRNPSVRKKPH